MTGRQKKKKINCRMAHATLKMYIASIILSHMSIWGCDEFAGKYIAHLQ